MEFILLILFIGGSIYLFGAIMQSQALGSRITTTFSVMVSVLRATFKASQVVCSALYSFSMGCLSLFSSCCVSGQQFFDTASFVGGKSTTAVATFKEKRGTQSGELTAQVWDAWHRAKEGDSDGLKELIILEKKHGKKVAQILKEVQEVEGE